MQVEQNEEQVPQNSDVGYCFTSHAVLSLGHGVSEKENPLSVRGREKLKGKGGRGYYEGRWYDHIRLNGKRLLGWGGG